MSTIKLTVAEYIEIQIENCGKRQSEIAAECSFEKPNVITMIKQGKTKLPMAKIGLMATSLGVDPIHLFKLVMEEYAPETWLAIEAMFDQTILTSNELHIVMALREAGLTTRKIPESERGPIVRAIVSVAPLT